MTRFRPCIDLRQGRVTQIVGGSLRDGVDDAVVTNFVADAPAGWYAWRYRDDGLSGGHVIMLGPGNDEAAREALAAWPGGLQVGGGITLDNATAWLEAGAAAVIVTSWLFPDGHLAVERAAALAAAVGRERVVVDLSCRRVGSGWRVATNRWQTISEQAVDAAVMQALGAHCAEFLVHAADVEGLCRGIDEDLVAHLAAIAPRPVTYAGGGRCLDDLVRVASLSDGRVDLTFGSALDLFGGHGVRYADCVAWNRAQDPKEQP